MYIIALNDAGQRLDKFLQKALPSLPLSKLYQAIRQKDVRLNGSRCRQGDRLSAGDEVRVFLPEAFFEISGPDFLSAPPELEVVYEDVNLLLINKPQGLLVHEGESRSPDTLILRILHYLYLGGKWDPEKEQSFTPALCHRIDRNTGGIVIAAKTFEALRIMTEKIRLREITKRYLCVVHGSPAKKEGTLTGYLLKDGVTKKVRVYNKPVPGARTALTRYRVLGEKGGKSLIEAELLTGRTHQIRAQLAAAGHPILGDAKYGDSRENAGLDNRQALCAYYVGFDFKSPAGSLDYLTGRCFSIDAPFSNDFPVYSS
ncbi:MAG: RluA family pseudouridine synthase [Oscillospiraceae bacterium]|nr:RluA family pseudouridine synthase [Oscillospiraceae bacterium]